MSLFYKLGDSDIFLKWLIRSSFAVLNILTFLCLYRWFCHFDDDNYVNVPALLDLLARYDPKDHWYLGKPSLKSRIHFLDPDNKSVSKV
jgi:hypothetical protein